MSSPWFLLAIALFLAIIAGGVLTRTLGAGIVLLNPRDLYYGWLGFEPWEFKKNAIYWAGEHFDRNRRALDQRARVVHILTVLFVLELLCLIVWVASA